MKFKILLALVLSIVIGIVSYQNNRKESQQNSVNRTVNIQPISPKLNSIKLNQQKEKQRQKQYEFQSLYSINFPLYCNGYDMSPRQKEHCLKLKSRHIKDYKPNKYKLPYTTNLISDSLLTNQEKNIIDSINVISKYNSQNQHQKALKLSKLLFFHINDMKDDTLKEQYHVKLLVKKSEIYVKQKQYNKALSLSKSILKNTLSNTNSDLIILAFYNFYNVVSTNNYNLSDEYPIDSLIYDLEAKQNEQILIALNIKLGQYHFLREENELAKGKLLFAHQLLIKQTKKRYIQRLQRINANYNFSTYTTINDFTEELKDVRMMLGFIFLRNKEFEEAEDWFFGALDIYHKELYPTYYQGIETDIYTDKNIADILFWICNLFIEKGEYSKAINYLNQSQYIYENAQLGKHHFYVSMGNIFLQSNNKKEALQYHLEALQYVNSLDIKSQLKLYYSLGNSFLANNNKTRAKECWLIVDSIATAFNINSYINDANERLAEFYLKDSLYHKAIHSINKAIQSNKEKLNISIELTRNIHLIENFNDRAMIYQAMYENTKDTLLLSKAYEDISIALKILEYNWSQFLSEEDRNNLLSSHKYVYQNAAVLLTQIYLKTKNKFYLAKSFNYINFSKSNTFSLKLKETFNKSNIPLELFTQKQMLEDSLKILEQKITFAQQVYEYKSDYYRDWVANKVNLRASLHMLINNIKSFHSKYHKQVYEPNNISSKRIQSQLEKSEVFVNYFVMGNIVFSVTISKTTIEYRAKVCDINKINKYLEIIQSKNPNVNDFINISKYMFDVLFDKSILNYKNIIISPDHFINFISFDCLVTEEVPNHQKTFKSLPYLIKKANIEYTPSPNVWYLLKNTPPHINDNECLAFAPVIDKYYDNDISSLPASNYEINAISRRFAGDFYKNEDASISKFVNRVADKSVVHIASHGVLNADKPMFSEVILSAGASEQKLESFYVHDIYNMKLNNDLTVLSICNSSSGNYVNGEGVMSFTKALQHAGSSNVIGSLWEIDDYSTSRIFETFYKNIGKRKPISVSLRKAKLDYLDNQKATECIPYYWAAFSFSGKNEPLTNLEMYKKENHTKRNITQWFKNNYQNLLIGLFPLAFLLLLSFHKPQDPSENPYDI